MLGFKAGPLDIMRRIGDAEVERIIARTQRKRPGLPQPRRPLGDYQNFYRHVLLDDVGDVKVITIRRPDALNAINDDVTDEILAAIRRFEGDDAVQGFILTGYGLFAFSAGAESAGFPACSVTPRRPLNTRGTAPGCSCTSIPCANQWSPP